MALAAKVGSATANAPATNIAHRLSQVAALYPAQRAVVAPAGRDWLGRTTWSQFTFAQLEAESNHLAAGLRRLGVGAGTRIVLMVRPGLEFIALTFALFKVGAVVVLIDPGMGGRRVFRCLDEVEPEGFIAIPTVQVLRAASLGRFPRAKWNVTVQAPRYWPGMTYPRLKTPAAGDAREFVPQATAATDLAAIIFTSGSTGPAKGVAYEHGMFAAQADWIRDCYHIVPGEIDLAAFPLFALFNAALGVTTVIPDMNPTRPATVDPERFLAAMETQGVTQSYASPAVWNRVCRYCEERQRGLPEVKRILSAGAPVSLEIMRNMRNLLGASGEMHTPYGATEALPVSSISASEVLRETAARTEQGAGTCVGRPVPSLRVSIIRITDKPLATWDEAEPLPVGEIGEIVVQGAVVTREYFRRAEATSAAKISAGETFWHRMGDAGYFDEQGRLWFCGRKSQRVETATGTLFTECIEPIFNTHAAVYRSALVGVGIPGKQMPVLVVEPEPGHFPRNTAEKHRFVQELRAIAEMHPQARTLHTFLFQPQLPVDIRHNVKINREVVAAWAVRRV